MAPPTNLHGSVFDMNPIPSTRWLQGPASAPGEGRSRLRAVCVGTHAVSLDCDVNEAVKRKEEQMPEGVVRESHALTTQRFVIPDEIKLDTTFSARPAKSPIVWLRR